MRVSIDKAWGMYEKSPIATEAAALVIFEGHSDAGYITRSINRSIVRDVLVRMHSVDQRLSREDFEALIALTQLELSNAG